MDQLIYRLKVTLREVRPPVWRRIEVPAATSLFDLHRVLQAAMGWTDSHLHQFAHRTVLYGPPDREFGQEIVSERRTALGDLLKGPKDRLIYEYDFGDDWQHDVVLEAIVPADPEAKYPRVTAGRRACPPEDSGGPFSYADFLAAIRDTCDPDYSQLRDWVGDRFDPEHFDLVTANDRLPRRRASLRRDA